MIPQNAVKIFNKYLKATGKSANTIKSYNYDLKPFLAFLMVKRVTDIGDVGADDIIDFLESRRVSNSTNNRTLYALRQLFNCLILQNYHDKNPAAAIKRLKSEDKPVTTLNEDEEMKLRGVVKDSPKWNAIVELMLYLPLRVSEVCNLKEGDVILHEDRIVIRTSKSKKGRELPISEALRRILKQYKKWEEWQRVRRKWDSKTDYFFVGEKGRQLTPRSVRYNFKKFYKKTKIDKRASTHTLRHTVCTRYGIKGMDPFTLRELAGHKDLKTTQRYVSVTIKDKRNAIEQLEDQV